MPTGAASRTRRGATMTGNEDDQAATVPATATEARQPVAARPSGSGSRRPHRAIDDTTRDRIGRGLRLHYAEVLALPIPDRLRMLLDDLAACSDTEVQS